LCACGGSWIPASTGLNGVRCSVSILARRSQLGLYLRKHCLDLGLHRSKFPRIARADHNVGVRPMFLVNERVAPNDRFGMRLGNHSELGTDVAFLGIGPDCL